MKKLHISVISVIAIALLACICTSNIFPSENEDVLTQDGADFTTTPIFNSKDLDAGKVLEELNRHEEDKQQYFSDDMAWESYDTFFCI